MTFQRRQPSATSFTPTDSLWAPELPAGISPAETDLYVAIDERIEGRIRAAVAGWPRLDRAGRLNFERDYAPAYFDETVLQVAVDAQRQRHGQLQRALRIGDAFLVRGGTGRNNRLRANPARWQTIVDVSAPAREEAKIALYSAVAPFVDAYEPVAAAPPQSPGERPRPGPTARPSV